jgi:hypothetical protein
LSVKNGTTFAELGECWRTHQEKKSKLKAWYLFYVHALFVKPPKFIFDRKVPITHKQFTKVYDLNNIGPCPRMLSCERVSMNMNKWTQWNLFKNIFLTSTKYYLTHKTKYLVTWRSILPHVMDEQFSWMKTTTSKVCPTSHLFICWFESLSIVAHWIGLLL